MRFLYQPKYLNTPLPKHKFLQREPQKVKNDYLTQLLMPSFLGIILCAICLAGTTYAWYTATVSTPTIIIESANFGIHVEIKDGGIPVLSEDGYYFLSQQEQGEGYIVTVEAIGTASKGYFKINDSIYPEQLVPGRTLTFVFYPETAGKYIFTAVWGNYSESDTQFVIQNGAIGCPKG